MAEHELRLPNLISFVRVRPGQPFPSGIYLHSDHLAEYLETVGCPEVAVIVRDAAVTCAGTPDAGAVDVADSGVIRGVTKP